MSKKVRIKGISKKMRNKIKQHGDIWNLILQEGNLVSVETTVSVHSVLLKDGTREHYPYSIWAELGLDLEIVEEL